jgi:predicted NUDIX family phosphoesterase
MHTDEAGITRLFYAQRRNNADRELGGKWTIGMGGHINPQDSSFIKLETRVEVKNLDTNHNFDATILECNKRELKEEFEMNWQDVINIEYRALIFTSADGVSKDHIAMVIMIKLATQNVKVKDELFRGLFCTQEEFLIYIGFSEFLNWLHTPEGIEYETQKWKNRREKSTSS